jgi:hypothetical protein
MRRGKSGTWKGKAVLALVMVAAGWPLPAAAQLPAPAAPPQWEDLYIPGRTSGLARVLEIDAPLPRARFLPEVIRSLYSAVEPSGQQADARRRVADYLAAITTFQDAWAAGARRDGYIGLRSATDKSSNERVQAFLQAAGLRLEEAQGVSTVSLPPDRDAEQRRAWLATAGVDVPDLARRLAAGEDVRPLVPADSVPLPLSAEAWGTTILGRDVPARNLCAAILSDRNAALLYYGLVSLDGATLAFLASAPALLADIYREHAGVFASFARSLRAGASGIEPPGGPAASALWEQLVGERVERREQFVREIMGRDGGHLALFYDTVAHLDEARTRYVLQLGVRGAGERRRRLQASYDAFRLPLAVWKPALRPFVRLPFDGAQLLRGITVTADGRLSGPPWRRFWEAVFDDLEVPGDAADRARRLEQSPEAEPSLLLGLVGAPDMPTRRDRLETLLFTQRVFPDLAAKDAADGLVAARGFVRFRALMLTLERIGIRDPAVYAAAALRAARLGRIGDTAAAAASLAGFQAALAVIDRARSGRLLDPPTATTVVRSLLDVAPGDDGFYHGALARWFGAVLLPALATGTRTRLSPSTREHITRLALAGGAEPAPGFEPPVVRWEDQPYRVDVAAPEMARIEQVVVRLAPNTLGAALDLADVALSLEARDRALADILRSADRMALIAAGVRPLSRVGLAAGGPPPDIAGDLRAAADDLRTATLPKDLRTVVKIGRAAGVMADLLLADALAALLYAAVLGDPQGAALLGGNVTSRHDFGLRLPGEARLRWPWGVPRETWLPPAPWHVEGSLLGLDVGLARLALRPRPGDRPPLKPALNENEQIAFSEAVTLTRPLDLDEAGQKLIAAALERGRAEMARVKKDPREAAAWASRLPLDEWRLRALPWLLANEPDRLDDMVSLTEIVASDPAARGAASALAAWGPSGRSSSGCLCTRFPEATPIGEALGREGAGFVGAQLADLKLRLAELLEQEGLPAALLPSLLAAATADFIAGARQANADDWLSVATCARSLTRAQLEDYVAVLTAGGPLVPVSAEPKLDTEAADPWDGSPPGPSDAPARNPRHRPCRR